MTDLNQNRCRLILSLPAVDDGENLLKQALSGGDVASVILSAGAMSEQEFLDHCKKLVPIIQEHDVAALVAGDGVAFGRSGADGILVESGFEALKDALARFSPQKIVGCGAVRERHRALDVGEQNPDFIFFGNLDKDIRAEPHKKNLALADWWAQLVEIPCAVMGGNTLESVVDIALSGAEFAVLSKAVFAGQLAPGDAVGKANELLDEFGPKFEEA